VLEPCLSLWIGDRLGPVERACLRSALRQGHEVALYCYRRVDGIPAGVELRDAAAILGEDRMIRHRGGSVALFANWFRYELQRRGLGIWIDVDQYLLAPIVASRPHLYGWEDAGMIASAVLKLPCDSPILPDLIKVFEQTSVPFWLSRRQRLAAHFRLWTTGRSGLSHMPWGTAGPHALTALAKRHGLAGEAVAPEIFYPVHYRNAGWLRDPSLALEDMVTPNSIGIHLWNELIKGWKNDPPPAGSFLARLHREGA
jgi:Alpha 1,4-glycosyltransferase conserved region